ncbi:MAG: transglutaminase domain-containing protein [Candidatus Sericytochromatia bacterium]
MNLKWLDYLNNLQVQRTFAPKPQLANFRQNDTVVNSLISAQESSLVLATQGRQALKNDTRDLPLPSVLNRLRKHLTAWLIMILIHCFCFYLNFWIYQHRSDGFLFNETSYEQIYYPLEAIKINSFRQQADDRLLIVLNHSDCQKWLVQSQDSVISESQPFPVLHLKAGIHTYTCHCVNKKDFDFNTKIQYTPSESYKKINTTFQDNSLVLNSSIPMGNFQQLPLSTWLTFYGHQSQDELQLAKKILRQEIKLNPQDPTLTKIEKIGGYLLHKLGHHDGIPNQRLASHDISVLNMLHELESTSTASGTGIWCTQFARIYSYFAKAAGIPSRWVFATGSLNDVKLSGHAIAESYISEQKKWAYIDLSSRKLYLFRQDSGEVLNTLDLFYYHNLGLQDQVLYKTLDAKSGRIIEAPYVAPDSDIEHAYLNSNATIQFAIPTRKYYSALSRLRRYLFQPDLVFRYFPQGNKHDLKYLALLGWFMTLLACVLMGMNCLKIYRQQKNRA